MSYDVGDVIYVAMESWAGRTYHAARVERLCPKRVRVFWLDCGVRHGTSSYVPRAAIRISKPERASA
jgi:hypothetical protein